MKKALIVLTILLFLCGCDKKTSEVNYPYSIVTKDVDMSGYEGVNSTKHNFKGVIVTELFNCIDNKSSGIFYLGRTNCGCCQTCVKYINKAAEELGVTVYYLDVYDPDYPLNDTETCDKLKLYLDPILFINEEGEKELQTPTIFSVINGELVDSIICLSDYNWDTPPTENQENKLVNRYKEIFKPFVVEK